MTGAIGVVVVVGLMGGCEKGREEGGTAKVGAPAAPTVAATAPAAAATGPGVAATGVAVEGASVTIDGVAHAFPSTGVKLRVSGERMTAVVYSLSGGTGDEGHDAMNLRFSFPAEDWESAGSGVGRIVIANAGREESPFGLFLDDGETQLVPADVSVEVRRGEASGVARVSVKGRFVRKDLIAPDMPFATVAGEFEAAIEETP